MPLCVILVCYLCGYVGKFYVTRGLTMLMCFFWLYLHCTCCVFTRKSYVTRGPTWNYPYAMLYLLIARFWVLLYEQTKMWSFCNFWCFYFPGSALLSYFSEISLKTWFGSATFSFYLFCESRWSVISKWTKENDKSKDLVHCSWTKKINMLAWVSNKI